MRRRVALELIHTDVYYVDAKSHAGAHYFVTFIDYYSQNLWPFVLEKKDRVLSVFKKFLVWIKAEIVQINNGGEYRGQFEKYCRYQVIKIEYMVPKNPELNGMAKRMNRKWKGLDVCFLMPSYQKPIGLRH